jgi:hemolysin-activating ACP:hemolysin acyltransferase
MTDTRQSVSASAARNSDAEIWVVDCLAPFGGTEEMIKDLKEKVFPAREVKWRSVGVGGASEGRVV